MKKIKLNKVTIDKSLGDDASMVMINGQTTTQIWQHATNNTRQLKCPKNKHN